MAVKVDPDIFSKFMPDYPTSDSDFMLKSHLSDSEHITGLAMDTQPTMFSNIPKLALPLVISPERFDQGYNYPIEQLVDSRPGGKTQVKYLSYTHAFRIFKTLFPELNVECMVNPTSGSYVWEEADGRGFYIKPYIHDGVRVSSIFYFAVLTTSMGPVMPGEVVMSKNYTTNKQEVKTFNTATDPEALVVLNTATINKAFYRAMTKVIALVTGIGLKLWTGDDLTDPVVEEPVAPVVAAVSKKFRLVTKIKELLTKYEGTGKVYPLSDKEKQAVSTYPNFNESLITEEELTSLGKGVKDALSYDAAKDVVSALEALAESREVEKVPTTLVPEYAVDAVAYIPEEASPVQPLKIEDIEESTTEEAPTPKRRRTRAE